MNTCDNILVIKLGALGDFIQALGPMAAIRRHHPKSHITLLTSAPFQDLALQSDYFDEIRLDEKPRWSDPAGLWRLRQALRAGRFDRVYDLQNSDRTQLYFWLTRPGGQWVGAAFGASHRNASPQRTAGHAFDGHVQTLGRAGISDIEIDRLEWLKSDCSRFALRPPYVLLVPGSAPERPEKRWALSFFKDLAETLNESGTQPVILGTDPEHELGEAICAACPQALNLCGLTSLAHLPELARGAAGAVGNDTGPMHLIAATGCLTRALFTPASDPVRHAPKGEKVRVIHPEDAMSARKVMDTLLS